MEQVLTFECFPARTLTLLLFTDVSNCKQLREDIISGSLEPEAAFFNATTVAGPIVVHAAGHRALEGQQRGTLTTRTLHTELVFNVAGSKHIAQSLAHFGIRPETSSVLVGRFDATPAEVASLVQQVHGTPVPLSALAAGLADTDAIKKQYKVSPQELDLGPLQDAVLARIAARECQ